MRSYGESNKSQKTVRSMKINRNKKEEPSSPGKLANGPNKTPKSGSSRQSTPSASPMPSSKAVDVDESDEVVKKRNEFIRKNQTQSGGKSQLGKGKKADKEEK